MGLASSQRSVTSPRKGTTSFPSTETLLSVPSKARPTMLAFTSIEMSKERLEKSERTLPVSWRPWALAYSPDRLYNFHACQQCRKTPFWHFFSASGCQLARKFGEEIWRGNAFREQQYQFLTRNKSLSSGNESNCSMTSEWRAYRFDFTPRRRCRARSM